VNADAADLRLLGGDVRRTATRGFRDDASIDALKKLRPMNLYGLEQASVRHGGLPSARRRAGEPFAAAMRRAKILQRVLGPNEYHKGTMMSVLGAALRRRQGRAPGATVSSPTAKVSPTATSAAISSMSTTSCAS